MLKVGDRFPNYALKAVDATSRPDSFTQTSQADMAGSWAIYVFWPKDFTFVCPTEIVGFDGLYQEFKDRDAQLVGVSTDSEFVHLAWRQSREDLAKIRYPWLADISKDLTRAAGVLHEAEGVALRATFIVDPDGIIRYAQVNDLSVGRNPDEVLRVLDALQTDELCPCNWQQGESVLNAA
jgi:lipoyl-dependent peroxiredoxin subunit C